MNKKGTDIGREVLVQLILIALVLALFLLSTGKKIDARGVRQDIVENQIALLIESGVPGMSFEIGKLNSNGVIDDLKLENYRVFATVDGLNSVKGRPYFSRYNVDLEIRNGKYVVSIS